MVLSISDEPWAVTIENHQGGDPMCLDDVNHLLVLHLELGRVNGGDVKSCGAQLAHGYCCKRSCLYAGG
jgi:hypothetical protein